MESSKCISVSAATQHIDAAINANNMYLDNLVNSNDKAENDSDKTVKGRLAAETGSGEKLDL